MATWLYPISEGAGRWFCLDDGTRCKVSVENYARLVRNGRLPEDKWWSVNPTYQTKRLGFDLLCSKGSKVKKVEVKGISGGNVCFIMTAGERKNSKNKDFVLHVVCNALSKHPIIKGWTGQQMEKNFAFAEINYLASLKN
jgi:hypothetical protein